MSRGCRGKGDGVGREVGFGGAGGATSTGSLGRLVRDPRNDVNVFPPLLPFDVSDESPPAATFPACCCFVGEEAEAAASLFRVLVRPTEEVGLGVDVVVPGAAEIIPVSNACAEVASSATATTSFALGLCLVEEERREASHLDPVRLLMLTGVVGPLGDCAMPPSSAAVVVASEHAVLDPAETEDADMLDGPAADGGCGGLRLLVGGDAALVSLLRVKSLDRGGVAGGPFAAA